MWQQVLGITTIKPNAVDPTKLFSSTTNTAGNTSLQMWSIAWLADYPDPQDWTTLLFGKGSAENDINYGQNKSADAAAQQAVQNQMVQADTISNSTQRFQTINQIEQQLVNDVAWLPIVQVAETVLVKPYIHGLVINAQDLIPPNDWGNIYVSTH
jgi:peptide/nickel transport system substrate-binding protein/oligopeptide transport system substrate-binding protein